MYPAHSAKGFTLVEILVSLVIGLLILAAVGSVYIGGKRTYSERDTLSLLQENGRIAIRQLTLGLSPAGFPASEDFDPFLHNATSLHNPTSDGVDGGSDSVAISFIPPAQATGIGYRRDCLGSNATLALEGDQRIVNRFSVSRNTLYCQGAGTPQPIADGIAYLDLEYGVVNATTRAITLHNATVVDGLGEWKNVVSIKAEIGVRTPKKIDPTYDDNKPPRIFSTIIPLRNRMQICDGCS